MPLHLIRIIVPQILGRLLVQFPHRKRYSLNFARLENFTMHQTYSTFLDGMRRWISPLRFLQHCETEVLNIEFPCLKPTQMTNGRIKEMYFYLYVFEIHRVKIYDEMIKSYFE